MNKYQDELLARFLAGEDNRAELRHEWSKDPEFKQRSARQVLTHRLMQLKLKDDNANAFADGIMERIKLEQNNPEQTTSDNVSQLNPSDRDNNKQQKKQTINPSNQCQIYGRITVVI